MCFQKLSSATKAAGLDGQDGAVCHDPSSNFVRLSDLSSRFFVCVFLLIFKFLFPPLIWFIFRQDINIPQAVLELNVLLSVTKNFSFS